MAPDMFQLSILISYDSFERSTCYHRIIQVSDEIVIDFKFPRLFNTFFLIFQLESEIPTFNLESQYNLPQFLSFDSNNDRRFNERQFTLYISFDERPDTFSLLLKLDGKL